MKLDTLLFTRRVRQNHALEHATFTVLERLAPAPNAINASARSHGQGFTVFGNIELNLLRRAIDEALSRLQAGEAELAIHPNCGTNLAVGVSLAMLGTLIGLTSERPRTRAATTAASSVAGFMAARPLGEYVQRHFTTLPDLYGVRVTDIQRRSFLGMTIIDVHTIQE